MIRGQRNAVILTLVVCALSSPTVFAKKHRRAHKPSTRNSGGTLLLETNSYQGFATLTAGTLLVTPPSYQGLILNSGYEALIANPVGMLALGNSYQNFASVSYGTLTVSNTATLASSGTIVSASTQTFSGSAGVLSLELSNSSNPMGTPSTSMGTLSISNAGNYSGTIDLLSLQQLAGSLTLLASPNVVIPSNEIFVTSDTLSVATPEPTGFGLIAFAVLIFFRRPSRK